MLIHKDIGLVILCAVLIILSSLFLVACFYAIPSADDYCYAGVFKNKGFINSQIYWYNNWSGRYIANLLLSLTPVDHASVGFAEFVKTSGLEAERGGSGGWDSPKKVR